MAAAVQILASDKMGSREIVLGRDSGACHVSSSSCGAISEQQQASGQRPREWLAAVEKLTVCKGRQEGC